MHKYPSDIDRSQFAMIAPILESSCKTTSPRTVDLYDVFCGILYVLKSGCQSRMMQKIIQIGILVTIIFDAGAKKKVISQRVYLKKF